MEVDSHDPWLSAIPPSGNDTFGAVFYLLALIFNIVSFSISLAQAAGVIILLDEVFRWAKLFWYTLWFDKFLDHMRKVSCKYV